MFRTTALRSAITTAALATALLAPTAALASPNTGVYAKTQGVKHSVACANYQTLANYDSDQATAAYHAGDKAAGAQHQRDADGDYRIAKNAGCAWAG